MQTYSNTYLSFKFPKFKINDHVINSDHLSSEEKILRRRNFSKLDDIQRQKICRIVEIDNENKSCELELIKDPKIRFYMDLSRLTLVEGMES